MSDMPRKEHQKTLADIDDTERIETGYWLGRFYKSIKYILIEHRKPLSWLAKHAGKSKPWWGFALKDVAKRKGERSAIVVRGRELKSAVLIASLLEDSANEDNRKLAARLEIIRAQAELNSKINAYVRIR